MITQVTSDKKIVIPDKILEKLSLEVGDEFEVASKDGIIYLIPVVTYPEEYIKELDEDSKEMEKKIQSGEYKVYDNVFSLFEALDNNQ